MKLKQNFLNKNKFNKNNSGGIMYKTFLLSVFIFLFVSKSISSQTSPSTKMTDIKNRGGLYQNPKTFNPRGIIPEIFDIGPIHFSEYVTQSEMSIAVHPLNNQILLASANATDYNPISHQVNEIFGATYYYSTNAGLSWSGVDELPGNLINGGDPAAAIDRYGNFYIGCISASDGQGILRSTDQGGSWTYITVANTTDKLLDKNHLTIDNSAISPYSGYLYSGWSDFNLNDAGIVVARSTDHGSTWNSNQKISDNSSWIDFDH